MKDSTIGLFLVIPMALGLGILFASVPIRIAMWILGVKL